MTMQSQTPVVVIYHGQCPDGYGGRLAAWLKFGWSATYHAAAHGGAVPKVDAAKVYLVDFCYPKDILEDIARRAKSVTVLDHHLSTEQNLAGWTPPANCTIVLDQNRSGSVLAWNHFHPGQPVPMMFRWIEDRDLWKFEVPNTRDYTAWLDAQRMDHDSWLAAYNQSPEEQQESLHIGRAMNDKLMASCRMIANEAREVVIDGEKGLMVCASNEFHSEVGNLLAQACGTFGLVWCVRADGLVKCGIRSNGYDVQCIAKRYGGGGHRASSAFTGGAKLLLQLFNGELVCDVEGAVSA